MEIFIKIILMMIIGAIIGGFTNYLAIKMLFRPYRAYYIGKWRIPFTPGLIPKRRQEMANQMGKMVVGHLLTPDSLQNKLRDSKLQADLTSLAQVEIMKLLETDKRVIDVLEQFQIQDSEIKLQRQMDVFIEHTYERLASKYREQPLKEILSEEVQEKVALQIPVVSQLIIDKATDYFFSVEGKIRVQRMFDDFLKERGMLGNMLQMFLGNSSLADKIQPEIIKFLQSEGTTDLLNTLLTKEWNKITEWKFEEIENWFEQGKIISTLQQYAQQVVNIEELLNKRISSLIANYKDTIIEVFIPRMVVLIGDWLASRMESILEKLQLAKIVSDQVETFPVERLEEMVLSITSSELKMITYLGFFLGALIGIVQGIIAVIS